MDCTKSLSDSDGGRPCEKVGGAIKLRSKIEAEMIVQKYCQQEGWQFIGWVDRYVNSRSKLKLRHPEYGVWESLSLDKMLQGRKHPKDRVKAIKKVIELSEEDFINSFSDQENKIYCKDTTPNVWKYKCKICSQDEYVKAGLCTGIFKSTVYNLRRGSSSCRCSKVYKWTEQQRRFQLEKKIQDNNLPFRVEGFIGKDKVRYECELHGTHTALIQNFLRGSYCKSCAGIEHQYGYICSVKDGENIVAIKFGVSNNPENRIRRLNSRNIFQCQLLYVFKFENTFECLKTEKVCKSLLSCPTISHQDMPEGYTETCSILDIDVVISIFTAKADLIKK